MSEKEFEKYRQHRVTVICTMCLKYTYCINQLFIFTSGLSRTSFQGREDGIFKWCFVLALLREECVHLFLQHLQVCVGLCVCYVSNQTTLVKGTIFALYIMLFNVKRCMGGRAQTSRIYCTWSHGKTQSILASSRI